MNTEIPEQSCLYNNNNTRNNIKVWDLHDHCSVVVVLHSITSSQLDSLEFGIFKQCYTHLPQSTGFVYFSY